MQLLPAFAGMPDLNKVYNCDAFTLLAALPDKSVDAFITDLPYGTTACSWDEIIPFAPMWAEVRRTLKPRGVFVTTASQPFTTRLIMSNFEMFKYEWIWVKNTRSNFLLANYQPLKMHENVIVFSGGNTSYTPANNGIIYYPQMHGKTSAPRHNQKVDKSLKSWAGRFSENYELKSNNNPGMFPVSYLVIDSETGQHPTQKPVALYEYLIRTYTQPADLVVDFCCGSGTTALAARNLNRNYIVGDITPQYVEVARKRLAEAYTPLMPIFLEQESA